MADKIMGREQHEEWRGERGTEISKGSALESDELEVRL